MILSSNKFSSDIFGIISPQLKRAEISEIKQTDGRTGNAKDFSKSGSFVYVIYNGSEVLYVGESGTSLKNRLYGDGSGAHKVKSWFDQATHVMYLRMESDELGVKDSLNNPSFPRRLS